MRFQLQKEITRVWIAPIQLHTLVMACFASLVAPFGGYMASGTIKRSLNI
jgi:phosphatidate cytidylyltransferase